MCRAVSPGALSSGQAFPLSRTHAIYNYMALNLRLHLLKHSRLGDYTLQSRVLLPDGMLDCEKVLRKFREFMKQEYSQRDTAFLERNGRLVFLAFLKPIINGNGYDFKEPQISEEKRLDVAITWLNRKYVVELKIWRGEITHQKGLEQLYDYLERIGLETGYLVVFDLTRKGQESWKQEHLQVKGKRIFAVWV